MRRQQKCALSLLVLLGLWGGVRAQDVPTTPDTAPAQDAPTSGRDTVPTRDSAAAGDAAAAQATPSAPNTPAASPATPTKPADTTGAAQSTAPTEPVAPAGPAQPTAPTQPANAATPTQNAAQPDQDVPYHWLDKTRSALYDTLWHSAAHVDRWFGSAEDDAAYKHAYGSIAPALLYTQYDGLRTQVRFNMNIPLPQVNDRIHAFVGRFDPNEFITERDEPSGAIPRTYGPPTEDQTLLGIGYHQPDKQGSRFDAGAGVRLGFPMDPYVKGAYVFERGKSDTGLFSVRETLFWQNSDGAGETTRFDLERVFDRHYLLRYTLSGTRSQMSEGLRGYSSILFLHGMPNRRAFAFEVGVDGQTQAEVPLHDYGFKAAYRQGILRRWLIMEVRTSVDWPKDFRWQHRSASLGVGFGFEMLLGTDEFLARPVTF